MNALLKTVQLSQSSLLLLCFIHPPLRAQTADSQSTDPAKSWTVSSESKFSSGSSNPLRTTESHTQSGNRKVDKRSVERIGPDGSYQPYLDTETESVQVNSSTVRTTTRTFGRGPSQEKTLLEVKDDETQNLAGGEVKSVRVTSTPDLNGRLQVAQREVEETRKTGPSTIETKTTVSRPDLDGALSPSSMTVERQNRTGEFSSEFQKSTKIRDSNGNWQVSEVREGTIKGDGKTRTTEENVLHPDAEGRLSVTSRTVTKEAEGAAGEKKATADTYSTYIPGSSPDSGLHLSKRVTTVQKAGSAGQTAGQTTRRRVEEPKPGDSSAGLQSTTETIDIVRSSPGGMQTTRTTQALTGNGDLATVEVDTRKSDKVQTVNTEPQQEPKQ